METSKFKKINLVEIFHREPSKIQLELAEIPKSYSVFSKTEYIRKSKHGHYLFVDEKGEVISVIDTRIDLHTTKY